MFVLKLSGIQIVFILGTAEQCMLGIQLLSQLTCEMNQIREGVELNPTRD